MSIRKKRDSLSSRKRDFYLTMSVFLSVSTSCFINLQLIHREFLPLGRRLHLADTLGAQGQQRIDLDQDGNSRCEIPHTAMPAAAAAGHDRASSAPGRPCSWRSLFRRDRRQSAEALCRHGEAASQSVLGSPQTGVWDINQDRPWNEEKPAERCINGDARLAFAATGSLDDHLSVGT
jgi:hypothetical protein